MTQKQKVTRCIYNIKKIIISQDIIFYEDKIGLQHIIKYKKIDSKRIKTNFKSQIDKIQNIMHDKKACHLKKVHIMALYNKKQKVKNKWNNLKNKERKINLRWLTNLSQSLDVLNNKDIF